MPITIDPNAYYSEAEVAELLGRSACTVRRARQRSSTLPFCRYGRSVFYRGADIAAALEAGRRTSTSDVGSSSPLS